MKRLKFPLDCEIIKLKPLYKKDIQNTSKKLSPRFTFGTCFKSYRESYS